MMKAFSLEEVYEYAEKMGYSREDVNIEKVCCQYDYDLEEEVDWDYEVSFGHIYSEYWSWSFKDLDGVAFDYEHEVVED